MALLSWGKCGIKFATSSEGKPGTTWTDFDTPKDGTSKLTPTAGTQTVAQEEGGGVVDIRNAANTYKLEFDIFAKKGKSLPSAFTINDGVISGEYAFRVIPEDDKAIGIQIDRAVVHVEENYSSADGILYHFVVDPLKPATGNTVKFQTIDGTTIGNSSQEETA
jgi:hypothetical protein